MDKKMKVVDATGQEDTFIIEDCPVMSHENASQAADTVEEIREKYNISEEDMDSMFQGMLVVFIRGEYCRQKGFTPDGKENN